MDDKRITDDQRDETRFWVDCLGCGYGGKIGLPKNYPADVVVCPRCRQVVRVRPIRNSGPRPSSRATAARSPQWPTPRPGIRQAISDILDNEVCQCVLIVAVSLVPLVLAIFVPRAFYRARMLERERVAVESVSVPPSAQFEPAATNVEPPPVPEAPTPAYLYRRGKQRRAKGDYMAAICDLDEVLSAKPEFVWCYYERAGAYSLMGNQQAALNDLDRAIVAMPAEPKVWRARAVVHHRMQSLMAAVVDICRAVELTDGDAGRDRALARQIRSKADKLIGELLEHATAFVRSGQYEAAIEEFSEVVKRRPAAASAWLRRGLAYDLTGQYDQALDDLNVAIALRPGPAQAFQLRSVLRERNHQDFAAALADTLSAQRLAPANREYAERIRWLRSQQQAHERARQLAVRWRG